MSETNQPPAQAELPPAPLPFLLNLGLVQRALREIFWVTVTLSLLLGSVSGLLAYAMPRIQERVMRRNRVPGFVRELRNSLLGIDNSMGASPADLGIAIAWSHPIIIALVAAHAIIVCTRILAAEVERGTVDVLLALPVSRFRLFLSETFAWFMSAVMLFAGMYAGTYVGSRFVAENLRPDFTNLLVVLANLVLVYSCIGMIAMLGAVMWDRRVRAVLAAIILTVLSVLINFLHALDDSLEFTKQFRFLSILDYYRPIDALMSGNWPWQNLGVLAGTTLGLWILAVVWLSRRDVTTT